MNNKYMGGRNVRYFLKEICFMGSEATWHTVTKPRVR